MPTRRAISNPGPAAKDVLIAEVPSATPLGSAELAYAFRRWDVEIGAK